MKKQFIAATLAISSLALFGVPGGNKAHAFIDYRDDAEVVTYTCTYISHGVVIAERVYLHDTICPALPGSEETRRSGKDGIEDCTTYIIKSWD